MLRKEKEQSGVRGGGESSGGQFSQRWVEITLRET